MAIRITYDSKTIDILVGDAGLQTSYTQEREQNRSGSGKTETLNSHGIQVIEFDAWLTEANYRDLVAWWSWARQGKSWAFAMDSAAGTSTTLDDAAASGQKNIPLTATAGFSADDVCLIRAQDSDDEFEIVVIDSVDAGVKIVADENLKNTYGSADLFRHYDYFPDVVSLDTAFNPTKTGSTWRHVFRFIENL